MTANKIYNKLRDFINNELSKKFNNEFNEILDEVEHFLKVLDYDWLEIM